VTIKHRRNGTQRGGAVVAHRMGQDGTGGIKRRVATYVFKVRRRGKAINPLPAA
jgi:hypothetical protein